MIQVNLKNDNTRIVRREQTVEVFSHQGPDGSWENYDAARCEEIARAIKDQGPDGAVQLAGIPFEVRWGSKATSSRVATCVEIKFTARLSPSTPSTRRLLDSVRVPIPRRPTEPARPRHRREMT